MTNDRRALVLFLLFLAVYTAALLSLLDHIPFWLDEIAEMFVLIQPNLHALIDSLRTMSGGTPLPYVVSAWIVKALGPTVFAARLASAISSVASCVGVYWLSRRSGMKWPLTAVALFALCPLQFRYAMEARPYAMALAFSVWSTVLFVQLLEDHTAEPSRRSIFHSAIYCLLVTLTASTMIYALFVPAAHALWLLGSQKLRAARQFVFWVVIVASTMGVASVVPWYLLFRADWAANSQQQRVTAVSFAAVNVMLHELTGAGYIGTGLVAIGVGLAFFYQAIPRVRGLLAYASLAPIILVPIADIVLYYFFAVRQLIMILPALLILFVAGVEHRRVVGGLLLNATFAAFLYADINWLMRPHENWDAAGAAATAALTDENACVVLLPGVVASAFLIAHPDLDKRLCGEQPRGPVVLAISPYNSEAAYRSALQKLDAWGYTKQSEQSFAGPRVEVYVSR